MSEYGKKKHSIEFGRIHPCGIVLCVSESESVRTSEHEKERGGRGLRYPNIGRRTCSDQDTIPFMRLHEGVRPTSQLSPKPYTLHVHREKLCGRAIHSDGILHSVNATENFFLLRRTRRYTRRVTPDVFGGVLTWGNQHFVMMRDDGNLMLISVGSFIPSS